MQCRSLAASPPQQNCSEMAPKRKRKIAEVKGEPDASEAREAELRAVLHERVNNMGLVDLIRLCAFTTARSALFVHHPFHSLFEEQLRQVLTVQHSAGGGEARGWCYHG
jgi:hypothetical protein